MSDKRAFALDDVIPKNIDLSTPPVSGIDYLYRVRLEARKCPKVVVADIDSTKFLERQTVTVDILSGFIEAREGCKPQPEWQKMVLKEFRSLKEQIAANRLALKTKFPRKPIPRIHDGEKLCLYCLGAENQKIVYDDAKTETTGQDKSLPQSKKSRLSSECQPPLLSVLVHLDQNRVEQFLNHFDVWLADVPFSDHIGKWLFSLLLCLEKPLDPDTCSIIRSISRHCCKFRNNISTPDDELLKPLNLIITIIAYYFDQKDLCDYFSTA